MEPQIETKPPLRSPQVFAHHQFWSTCVSSAQDRILKAAHSRELKHITIHQHESQVLPTALSIPQKCPGSTILPLPSPINYRGCCLQPGEWCKLEGEKGRLLNHLSVPIFLSTSSSPTCTIFLFCLFALGPRCQQEGSFFPVC